MTLLTVLGCVAAYLAIGLVYVAPRYVTRDVDSRIRRYGNELLEDVLRRDPDLLDEWRREAAWVSIPVAFVWPFYLALRLVPEWIAGAGPLTDYELRVKTEQQAKRIAELERELGITGREATRG